MAPFSKLNGIIKDYDSIIQEKSSVENENELFKVKLNTADREFENTKKDVLFLKSELASKNEVIRSLIKQMVTYQHEENRQTK